MALVLFKDIISKDPTLRSANIKVDSAGTSAGRGSATSEAIQVMREYGVDLRGHRSKPVDNRLVRWSDPILVMQAGHKETISSRFPRAADKIYTLSEYVGDGEDVLDPFGGRIDLYRECAASLQALLIKVADKLKNLTVRCLMAPTFPAYANHAQQ